MEMTSERLKIFSEILRDIGQVAFASLFIGPLINDNINFIFVFFGALLLAFAWYLSLSITKIKE